VRWLASGFFVAAAVVCVLIGLRALIPTHAVELVGSVSFGTDEDTARGVLVGVGAFLLLVAIGAVYGAIWVFRRWPNS
jgi:hypothetical protein